MFKAGDKVMLLSPEELEPDFRKHFEHHPWFIENFKKYKGFVFTVDYIDRKESYKKTFIDDYRNGRRLVTTMLTYIVGLKHEPNDYIAAWKQMVKKVY